MSPIEIQMFVQAAMQAKITVDTGSGRTDTVALGQLLYDISVSLWQIKESIEYLDTGDIANAIRGEGE